MTAGLLCGERREELDTALGPSVLHEQSGHDRVAHLRRLSRLTSSGTAAACRAPDPRGRRRSSVPA
ncbi:MAG TPA: hypothetical protein VN886_02250, partial [Acidimicrobiales bacterium]|nr:hypothetical protein [Acidimicrobiales bacterium]